MDESAEFAKRYAEIVQKVPCENGNSNVAESAETKTAEPKIFDGESVEFADALKNIPEEINELLMSQFGAKIGELVTGVKEDEKPKTPQISEPEGDIDLSLDADIRSYDEEDDNSE